MGHSDTHSRIFQKPILSNITYTDAMSLLRYLGADVDESRAGSRVAVSIENKNMADKVAFPKRVMNLHKPHPGKQLKKYQVEDIRDFLKNAGYEPKTAR
jgi:hypothetical protein